MGRRRTTGDLIQELKQEADLFAKKSQGEYWSIGLVVGFEKHTAFVFHGEDKEPLKKLNELVEKGGEPVGFVGWITLYDELWDQKQIRVYTRALEEYADEHWVQGYLSKLVSEFGQRAAKVKGLSLGGPIKKPELN